MLTVSAVGTLFLSVPARAEEPIDSLSVQEVVVTGTRHATDVRHLPMTVTVISREKLTEQHQASILPTAMQQVPGLMVTSRSMMGYGYAARTCWRRNMKSTSATPCLVPHS